MKTKNKHTVTGAFGYSGKYIAKRLMNLGLSVSTLTNSASKNNSFKKQIEINKLDFQNPKNIVKALLETEVLYNTYWVRFNHCFDSL